MGVHTYIAGLGSGQGEPGLGRINYLLGYLGNPETDLRVVHVVGTNGKGSTSNFIASMLQANDLKVGLYTSPHLVRFNERIQINGVPINDRALGELLEELQPCLEYLAQSELGRPGMFEVATAVALAYFAKSKVDYAVLEAGLGGRYDATHVGRPLITVFTHIDLDHTEVLGNTVELIAAEKADVIPPGGLVVMAPQVEGAKAVIRDVAQTRGARIVEVDSLYQAEAIEPSLGGTSFNIIYPGGRQAVHIGMLGSFQITNALTALAAVHQLVGEGLMIAESGVLQGLANARWPGRLEVIETKPVVVLDGAHNLDGFRQLARNLPIYLSWERLHVIVAITGEKPIESMLEMLLPLADTAVFTIPKESRTKCVEPSRLLQLATQLISNTGIAPSFGAAYQRVQAEAGPKDVICVCGSLYLVGEARELLVDCQDSAGILPVDAERPKA